jgi:hypothetical protein
MQSNSGRLSLGLSLGSIRRQLENGDNWKLTDILTKRGQNYCAEWLVNPFLNLRSLVKYQFARKLRV